MSSQELHLPSMAISGFRGIGSLSLPRLGRVTLLAGRNGVGKTTVLEAVRVYASRGHPTQLLKLLKDREEVTRDAQTDEDTELKVAPDIKALFHGRNAEGAIEIVIGPGAASPTVKIIQRPVADWSQEEHSELSGALGEADLGLGAIKVEFEGTDMLFPWSVALSEKRFRYLSRYSRREWPTGIKCESIGPDMPSNGSLAQYWDSVALTEDEEFTIQALNLVVQYTVERIAIIGVGASSRPYGRNVVVKLKGQGQPVPLKSLGDGAVRFLNLALALANSRGGFLLIDEAENGIHFTLHLKYWHMVLEMSRKINIQVFATTHSFDCIRGFAAAALKNEAVEGLLVRLDRRENELSSVSYSEEGLKAAADQGIEVR